MTVKQNLEEMLSDAISLKRPEAEIDAIRAMLASYVPMDAAAIRERQEAFLRAVV